ncbi:MAG: amidohydrolase family protein [Ginsengibacter sp.]
MINAIDVHGHYGTYVEDNCDPLVCKFMSAGADEVVSRAKAAKILWTIVSPLDGLLPRGVSVNCRIANESAFETIQITPGLLQYVIVNPLQKETYDQARVMLKHRKCVGIKIHPEEHCYRIKDFGNELFEFFTEVNAPVMTHSGCPNSLPEDFVPFTNHFPKVRLLLAHLGNGAGKGQQADLQVRALQDGQHENIWIDTSSARSIIPGLIEWAVEQVGAKRLIFGSDTPLYHVAVQRERIEAAEISQVDKRLILRENAIDFFNLSEHLEGYDF